MKRIASFSGLLLFISILTTGCGSNSSNNDRINIGSGTTGGSVFIDISTAAKVIEAGESVTITITTVNTSITWPEKTGTTANYTQTGNTVVWTPPPFVGRYEFIVKATADSTRTATTTVTVLDSNASRKIVKAVAAVINSYVLLDDGSLWAAGSNSAGQLGKGDWGGKDTNEFVEVVGSGIIDIAAGGYHILALKDDGQVLAAGHNEFGQLGIGNFDSQNTFVEVIEPGSGVVAIAANLYHSLVLKDDGQVLAAGNNGNGQLGIGSWDDKKVSEFIEVIESGSGVVGIAAGFYHSLVLKDDGQVLAAGYNGLGQLGIGSFDSQNEFVEVIKPGSGIVAIAANLYHSLALTDSGQVLAAGNNFSGQLGIGNFDSQNKFVEAIKPGSGVIGIATGGYHSLALTIDGQVLATGSGVAGQLGKGNWYTQNEFVGAIEPEFRIIDIAAGFYHSLAVTDSGQILVAGNNLNGQLGMTDLGLHSVFMPVVIN